MAFRSWLEVWLAPHFQPQRKAFFNSMRAPQRKKFVGSGLTGALISADVIPRREGSPPTTAEKRQILGRRERWAPEHLNVAVGGAGIVSAAGLALMGAQWSDTKI